jgi:hypothetical protein
MMNKFTEKHLLRHSFYKAEMISLRVVNYMEIRLLSKYCLTFKNLTVSPKEWMAARREKRKTEQG